MKERTTEPSPRGLEPAPLPPQIGVVSAIELPGSVVVSDLDSSLVAKGTTAQAADEAPIVPEIDGVRADSADIPGVRESVATPPSVLPMGDNRLPSLSPPAEIQAPIETLVPEEPAPIEKPIQPLPSVEPSRPVLSEPASPVLEQSKPALEPSKPSTPAPSDPLPSRPTSSHGPLSKPVSSDPVPQTSRAADEVAEDRRDEPDALMDCLEELMWECETGEWAMEVCRTARRAMREVEEGSDEATATLGQLKQLADQAASLAGSLSDDLLASQVRRAEYALGRRLDVWQQAIHLGGPTAPVGKHAEANRDRLAACVDKVAAATSTTAEGHAWQKYLSLDVFRGIAKRQSQLNEDQSRSLARQILLRMNRVRMTDQQRGFVASGPMAEFSEELRRWAVGSVDGREVLKHIERYERTGLPSDARVLADDYQRLGFSRATDQQELSRRLESHYRNANVRFAVTVDLLNRLAPSRAPEYYAVDDRVMGRTVQGQSVNATKVHVRLIPDPQRLRLALEVNGQVSALTTSIAGPATFYDSSQSYYTAWKEMELGTFGIRLQPAEVRVQNDIHLRDVNTNLDPIPLIGALAQNVARRQYEQNKYAASQEVARKIEARAKQQIDGEVDGRLAKFSDRLQQRIIRPMDELALDPTTISAETGERRMATRLRLATPDQLGGHTPRPQAPADSLASLQLHESAMNNILEQLGLNGKTMTVKQLRQRLTSRFPKAGLFDMDPENDDAEITFAPRDAVRVRCDERQISLAMAIVALRRGPHEWNDFQVRIFYRPEVNGRSIELVRDGVIHLMGERLTTRAQIGLRGVFGKTFSKQRVWNLTPEGLDTDPRLADLAITQFAIHDGWAGIALGPKRPAAVARRPADSRQ